MKTKKPFKFRAELIVVAVICAVVFISLSILMSSKSTRAISNAGQFYMQGISRQVSRHFETTIKLRLNQVKSMNDSVKEMNLGSSEKINKELSKIAKSNGFSNLALMSDDGKMQMLYGKEMSVVDSNAFLSTLNKGEKKAAIGVDEDGNNVVLLGVSTVYPMKNNKRCTAVVAALPVEYITQTLSLEIDNTQTYSFIIRRDGTYVIRTDNESHANYFERVMDIYDEVDGVTPEMYIETLKEAMRKEWSFSSEMIIKGERRQLYCTKLNNSEWFLLTFMPYGVLKDTIDSLSKQWFIIALIEVTLVLAAFMLILFSYMKINKRQMKVLEDARHAAEAAHHTAEESRKKAELASKAKSEFLSNVSHDIRTPMNAIVGMTAIAQANIDDRGKIENCLEKIDISGKHLLGLINNVLDMSKIENGKMTLNSDIVSLRELMDNMVNIVKPQIRAKNQQFDVVVHDIISENVWCDSVRLNQVIINFLSNAVKFTHEGGSITMTLHEEPSVKGDDYVCVHLSIKDNGIGMSEEMKKTVFESFVREDSTRVHQTEGTGLGMAITKYIVDAMGGNIEVDSKLGVGSEFRVSVDLKKCEVKKEEMTLPEWNILVVDDDRSLCKGIVADLESMGVNAEWTLDGESALKMAKEHQQRGTGYDFILLDWKLPNMDGVETSRKMHEILGENVPIIMISAYDCNEIEDEARNAGITEFVSKPLFKSTLFHGLKKFKEDVSAEQQEIKEAVDFNGKRVLLAEDNELNWEIAESLLSELGLELDWAENGKICVDKFNSSPVGYYDVIFMDIRMPIMTGYEATRAIRALEREDAKSIPIIAMTADAFAEDVRKCIACGMNAHVAKPIDIDEIERLLEKFLN